MDYGSVVVISERATWEELRALPQSESHRGRWLRSVVVCYDPFWVIGLIGFKAMSFVLTEKTHIFVLFLTNDLCL